SNHPAAQARLAVPPLADPPTPAPTAVVSSNPAVQFFEASPSRRSEFPDTYMASELCVASCISAAQLADLESFGLLAGRGSGSSALYSTSDLAIAKAASGFLAHGVEARHLRGWRQSAEREASLFEQLVLPLLRQRNPQSRQQAADTIHELSLLGAELRAAMLAAALQHHLDS
ncbi:MAG: hypothetical protein WCI22_14795, partial [Actinomycetota bacterium]